MKTEITLLTSPQTFYSRFPIAGRILYQNLIRNNKFDVHFTEGLQLKCFSKGFDIWKGLWDEDDNLLRGEEEYDIFARGWLNISYGKFNWNCRFPLFYMYTGAMDHIILSELKTEIIFMTAYSVIDFRLLKTLLNDGRRVVMGGTPTMIYSKQEIRNFLVQMGVDRKVAEKNVIIVSGYVDLTTDLYKIFDNWKDADIPEEENDFTTLWECTSDGFVDYVNIYRKVFGTNISAIMTSECFWGKCRYCTYCRLPKIDFTKGTSVDKMLNYFRKLRRNYQSSNIFFNDSYLINTPYNTELLNKLSEDGFEISIFSGVKLMSNRKFLKFLNGINISTVCLGLESVNDFSLEYIKKGYGRKEVDYMFSQIRKYMTKNFCLFTFIMTDLPRNSKNKKAAIAEIRDDWNYLAEFKNKILDAGYRSEMAFSPLREFPGTQMIDNNLMRIAREDQMSYKQLSGLFGLYDYFNKKLGINVDQIIQNRCINEPFVRHVANGDFLESDMHYVDKDVLRYVAKWE